MRHPRPRQHESTAAYARRLGVSWDRARQIERTLRGECRYCGEPVERWGLCARHVEAHRKAQRERYHRMKKAIDEEKERYR